VGVASIALFKNDSSVVDSSSSFTNDLSCSKDSESIPPHEYKKRMEKIRKTMENMLIGFSEIIDIDDHHDYI
jgi:hypothetical protein